MERSFSYSNLVFSDEMLDSTSSDSESDAGAESTVVYRDDLSTDDSSSSYMQGLIYSEVALTFSSQAMPVMSRLDLGNPTPTHSGPLTLPITIELSGSHLAQPSLGLHIIPPSALINMWSEAASPAFPPPTLSRTQSAAMLSHGRGERTLNDLMEVSSQCISVLEGSNMSDLAGELSKAIERINDVVTRKEDEIINLQGVLKQLSETRAEAMSAKVSILESYDKLQADYSRVLRTAIGTQKDSRHNFSKMVSMRNKLMEVQSELRKRKITTEGLQAQNLGLKQANAALLSRIAVLEADAARLPYNDRSVGSVCQRLLHERTALRSSVLY
ncbi:hypothetical protein CEUSTIGMA_g3074.t1 [Chlamydomonas eustigma]|uniref:Uncharacterized protein n=1 Tax=Chlamydomonas eustigma TaxID=1157962 RepID=A0A250WYQ0_9CHLO|nr:hypothetical protein CEUSTIGMA_g3074.t1 [Chlamydomonas eustigma]|eukprot:GAX75630.1 hypothetical protein CEUSTIGMA_g3074.t1 [Chlamydomonas eustigma]